MELSRDGRTTFRRRYNYYYDDNNDDWEEVYVMKLFIKKVSNIILLNDTSPYSSEGIYRVTVSDENGREFSTSRQIGTPEPEWNEDIEICFSSCPIGQNLTLMVVRENCYVDPGTSTGEVVVGRATIPVPLKVRRKKERIIELVKLVGVEKKLEAQISFQTLLRTRKLFSS
ncbi:hypothetical protein RND71_031404 [Anisodus tanguticus]|uniref:C2 domain-containing protein n=1 Tax=Anisodus tanguticus TaxID=243964 RepID=A0AAE1RCE9_9SOLA|nr:hypothetical protein RND71_031403 [Anisodus tanguticus]KAK4348649.1 hypothetical protein RND71_031404 [Anisodus tanguticus]